MKKLKRRIQPVLEQLVEDLQDGVVEGNYGLLLAAGKEVLKTWGST